MRRTHCVLKELSAMLVIMRDHASEAEVDDLGPLVRLESRIFGGEA